MGAGVLPPRCLVWETEQLAGGDHRSRFMAPLSSCAIYLGLYSFSLTATNAYNVFQLSKMEKTTYLFDICTVFQNQREYIASTITDKTIMGL